MKKRFLDHISLDAFRVFETAARHMNFSAAARELLVTQAAVSRRIQKLEADLQTPLFLRDGRRLALTAHGEILFRRVQATLVFLSDGLDQLIKEKPPEIVTLSASGAISHIWLGRKLREYALENPAVSIRMLTTDSLTDLASEANDLAILYSLGEHPQWTLTRLLAEELTPVAAPAYLQRAAPARTAGQFTLEEVRALDLYDYDRVNVYWVTLRDWFQRLGYGTDEVRPRVVFSNYAMAVEAALRGNGVILGSRHMLVHHLRDGSLVELTSEVLRTGYGYYVGLPKAAPVSEEALRLCQWLVASAADDMAMLTGQVC